MVFENGVLKMVQEGSRKTKSHIYDNSQPWRMKFETPESLGEKDKNQPPGIGNSLLSSPFLDLKTFAK